MSDISDGMAVGTRLALQIKENHDEAQAVFDSASAQASLGLAETGQDVDGCATVIDMKTGHKGPGRPAGSKNKRSEEWADYILKQYRSPLIFHAETYSRPVELLAKELSCSVMEAFKVQQQSATILAQYVHQKLPQMVDVGGETGLIPLAFVVSKAYADQHNMDAPPMIDAEVIPIED